jgi:AcrR family transcriptional regulator
METSIAKRSRRKDALPTTEGAVRERLLREAMRLLANQGLNGASLRSIVRASEAANPSALHYHFGDRLALIRDITEHLRVWYDGRALLRLEAVQTSETYAIRDVLEAIFGPAIEMIEEPNLGIDAVRFISRLGWDFGHDGQALSADFHRRSLTLMVELLKPLLPDVGEEDLIFKVIANLNNVYNGIALRSYMWRSPLGASPLMRRENATRLRELLMRYLEGGLKG